MLAGLALIKQAGVTADDQKMKGLYLKAATHLEAVARRYSKDQDVAPEALYWCCNCYYRIGQTTKSYQMAKLLVWDYPESRWARYIRAWRPDPQSVIVTEE